MTVEATTNGQYCRFRLLGEFRINSPLGICKLGISGKTLETLAFLMLSANRSVRRASLSNAIWGERDESRARANLNTALWRINRVLKTLQAVDLDLDVTANHLRLHAGPSSFIDALRLDDAVREATVNPLPDVLRNTLMEILLHDSTAFLDGCSSEWVLIERERLFNLQIRGLTLLMQDLAESGRIEEALEYGRRILRMDPMRECVQRQVMWLHVLSGHQANAIRQYKEFASVLEKELGVAPMAETRALYAFIVSENSPSAGRAPRYSIHRDPADSGFDDELNRLRGFMTRLNSHRRSVFVALSENPTN